MIDEHDFHDADEFSSLQPKQIASTDRELLELAARAIGAVGTEEVNGEGYLKLHFADGSVVRSWNPLHCGGDAFDLAVKLQIDILQRGTWAESHAVSPITAVYAQLWGDDPSSATRRAIVRAAAEIGRDV